MKMIQKEPVMKKSADEQYIVYMDTGGTFSDAVILSVDGSFVGGKASTTPDDLETCFFNSIEDAAQNMGASLQEVLSSTRLVGFGTTAGTNAVITRTGAPKLGLITTRGAEDTTIIMKAVGGWIGLELADAMRMTRRVNPEPLIPRQFIRGVTERIDLTGTVIVPLYEDEVRAAVQEFIDHGVEGIAVCLLWSFLNNKHEAKIKEIIQEMAPNMLISLSSVVAPLVREHDRFTSTIMNLYIAKPVTKLFSKVEKRLSELGYKRPLLAMQGGGGLSSAKVVTPISTLGSGPVGGLVGVEFLKKLYGFEDAIGSDVGGTSFDINISPKEGPEINRNPVYTRFRIANPMLEVISLGAGGGTIAYVDSLTGHLRVGPMSAGADPGPACYDRGGTEPTITDADVVMNRIDPDYFMGGKIRLDRDKAYRAIKEKIADPLKMDVLEAAQGICKIIDNKMGNGIATILRERGLDPKRFVVFAFGGAGPAHCAGYTYGCGLPFRKVIVSPFAATFSSFGAATADVAHRYESSIYLVIPKLGFDGVTRRVKISSLKDLPPDFVPKFNDMYQRLEERAFNEMEQEGFAKRDIKFEYFMEVRYGGQLWEGVFSSPVNRINIVDDARLVIQTFENEYERLYGNEAMYPEGGIEIITIALRASCGTIKPKVMKKEHVGEDPSSAFKSERDVFFEKDFVKTKVYEMGKLQTGNRVLGPSIIEGTQTTFVVPPKCIVTVDEYSNMILENVSEL
jgi:N-methylhydantoinase A/oxoprolinase/acetone carboxylase beta subunit